MGTPQTSLARQNVVPVHVYALNSFFFLIPPQYISAKLDCHLFLQIYIIFSNCTLIGLSILLEYRLLTFMFIIIVPSLKSLLKWLLHSQYFSQFSQQDMTVIALCHCFWTQICLRIVGNLYLSLQSPISQNLETIKALYEICSLWSDPESGVEAWKELRGAASVSMCFQVGHHFGQLWLDLPRLSEEP